MDPNSYRSLGLWIAHASAAELETQLELSDRLEIVDEATAAGLVANAQEVGRMLNGLIGSLERPTRQP